MSIEELYKQTQAEYKEKFGEGFPDEMTTAPYQDMIGMMRDAIAKDEPYQPDHLRQVGPGEYVVLTY